MPTEALQHISDLLNARRVYSEPIERDGVVVIPAAQIGKTYWKAAIDWNRVILRTQLIGLAIFVCGAWLRRRGVR